MRNGNKMLWGLTAGCAMLVIILDTRTAVISAQAGLKLCIKTVIPSLFPFFVLSGMINSCLLGQNLRIFRPLGKVCKIPKGSESLLLVGFLGGYPVGAQLVAQAYKSRSISKATAHRMLGFCSNAGPAFIFGMLSPLFAHSYIPWVIWSVHIASALVVGCLLPKADDQFCQIKQIPQLSLPEALQNAIKNMASVCGWVILFRVIVGFCQRWFLWYLPEEIHLLVIGFLELSNGIVSLNLLPAEGLRFVLSSAMLAFGGLCVGMQTLTVTADLGSGSYFPGKVAQCLLSVTSSLLLQPILFTRENAMSVGIIPVIILSAFTTSFLLLLRRKKVVAFAGRMLYNTSDKTPKGVALCCSAKK